MLVAFVAVSVAVGYTEKQKHCARLGVIWTFSGESGGTHSRMASCWSKSMTCGDWLRTNRGMFWTKADVISALDSVVVYLAYGIQWICLWWKRQLYVCEIRLRQFYFMYFTATLLKKRSDDVRRVLRLVEEEEVPAHLLVYERDPASTDASVSTAE